MYIGSVMLCNMGPGKCRNANGLVHSFITTRLDVCNFVLVDSPRFRIPQLKLVLCYATKIETQLDRFSLACAVGIHSIGSRLIGEYSLNYSLGTNCWLCIRLHLELFTQVSGCPGLCSSSNGQFMVPQCRASARAGHAILFWVRLHVLHLPPEILYPIESFTFSAKPFRSTHISADITRFPFLNSLVQCA